MRSMALYFITGRIIVFVLTTIPVFGYAMATDIVNKFARARFNVFKRDPTSNQLCRLTFYDIGRILVNSRVEPISKCKL